MNATHPERFGTTNHAAAVLGIIIHKGDDYRELWKFVSLHLQADGDYTRIPIDLSNVVFDSAILDGDGTIVGTFTVDDTADLGVLEVSIYRADTDAMRVGSYTYWIDGADTDTGKRQTYAQGTLEVRRK
jgi:hypothetical protein